MRTKLPIIGAATLALTVSGLATGAAETEEAPKKPEPAACTQKNLRMCHVNEWGVIKRICGDETLDHHVGDHGGDFMPKTFYVDGDGDGLGTGEPQVGCWMPKGFSEVTGDCDDADAKKVRFDDRDRTVFHCTTGLEWEKKTFTNVNDPYTWSSNFQDPNGTAFTNFLPEVAFQLGGSACEHTAYRCQTHDPSTTRCSPPSPPPAGCWRLPEIDELATILDTSVPGCGGTTVTAPCIDPIFGPTASSNYWSATSNGNNPNYAWVVDVNGGGVIFSGKTFINHVRVVRSTRPASKPGADAAPSESASR